MLSVDPGGKGSLERRHLPVVLLPGLWAKRVECTQGKWSLGQWEGCCAILCSPFEKTSPTSGKQPPQRCSPAGSSCPQGHAVGVDGTHPSCQAGCLWFLLEWNYSSWGLSSQVSPNGALFTHSRSSRQKLGHNFRTWAQNLNFSFSHLPEGTDAKQLISHLTSVHFSPKQDSVEIH